MTLKKHRKKIAKQATSLLLENNKLYAKGNSLHKSRHPGRQAIRPSLKLAVVTCMDARINVEDLLGLQTGEAHIIRNAGGVVAEDVIRSLIISHHLQGINEIILIHHTRCGMLAFTDDLLRAGLEGDSAAEPLLRKATGGLFKSVGKISVSPVAFHAFRGPPEASDSPPNAQNKKRLELSVRSSMLTIINHPWLPNSGPDDLTVRGFIYDVDTVELEEVSYLDAMGSID